MLPVFVQMSPIKITDKKQNTQKPNSFKNNENVKNIGHFQFNLTKAQLQVMHMGQQQGWWCTIKFMHN